MRSRTVTRRLARRRDRFARLTAEQKQREAARQLVDWREEANHRAGRLSAPEVWELADDPLRRELIKALDSSGELQADLNRVCAEAIGDKAGRSLVQGSRPIADRGRLRRAP